MADQCCTLCTLSTEDKLVPGIFFREMLEINKASLRDLINATGLAILFKLDSNRWFFSLYDLEINWMTFKNNRAPLLGYVKLCALFQHHQWIQTGVTVQKCPIRVKICDFFVLFDLDLWPLTVTFCMDITFVNGDNFWKFHDDTITGTLWKRCDRQTRRTDRSVLRAAWLQLKFNLLNKAHY